VHPEGKDVLEWDNMIRRVAHSHNLPEGLVRDEMEFEQLRQQRQEQQEGAMKLAQQEQQASTYKDAATPMGEDSLASGIVEQAEAQAG